MVSSMEEKDFGDMKEIVRAEVDVAFLRVRYWLVVTVLANLLTVGIPVLVAGVMQFTEMRATSALALENKNRLDSRTAFISLTDQRVKRIEEFLATQHGFVAAEELPTYR